MAAETYFANFIAGQGDIDGIYRQHLAKGVLAQIRSGLLVDDVRTFGGCIDKVQELMGGRELALLAGGPPCQGFSIAGKRNACDPRNELVWQFLEIAELLNPPLVLMENVGAIQSPFVQGKQESVLPNLEEALQRTSSMHGGYSVVRLVLKADQFGVPQRRKRMFLVGIRKDVASAMGIPDYDSWDSERDALMTARPLVAPSVKTDSLPTANDAIWDLIGDNYAPIELAPTTTARQYASLARMGIGERLEVSENTGETTPPNHKFRSHKATTRTRFHLLRLFRKHGIPSNLFVLAGKGALDIESQLKPLEYLLPIQLPTQKVGSINQLACVVNTLGSLKQSQRALDGDSPSPTITTLPDDLCHYAVDRTLTVREMARLQSFPDSFVFRGKETTGGDKRRTEVPQYSQVGNAVPPLLAEALGLQLKHLLVSYFELG